MPSQFFFTMVQFTSGDDMHCGIATTSHYTLGGAVPVSCDSGVDSSLHTGVVRNEEAYGDVSFAPTSIEVPRRRIVTDQDRHY